MKVLFLNTWGGKVRDDITKFIEEQSRDTDIFCFQEVYKEMKLLCRDILPNYQEITAYKYVAEDDDFPQGIYVNKNITLLSSGTLLKRQTHSGLGIYVRVRLGHNDLYICNFHGLSRPVDKLDNPDRLKQSRRLIDFFKDKTGLKIIGGDFNLSPNTKSLQMFKENGYRDLIKEFEIPSTRNRLVWEIHPDNKQYYSDYVFVSPGVKIKNFSVPNIEISDHLPLILELE